LVTEVWLGDTGDPAAGDTIDVRRACLLIGATGFLSAALAVALTYLCQSNRL
jgi:hypothetical protein